MKGRNRLGSVLIQSKIRLTLLFAKPSDISALGVKPVTQHEQTKLNKLCTKVEHLCNVSIPEDYKIQKKKFTCHI